VKCGNLGHSKSFRNDAVTTSGLTGEDKFATSKKEAEAERVKEPQMQWSISFFT
jgi:hypothetical protein